MNISKKKKTKKKQKKMRIKNFNGAQQGKVIENV